MSVDTSKRAASGFSLPGAAKKAADVRWSPAGRIDAAIRTLVDHAPELTDAQYERLRSLLAR